MRKNPHSKLANISRDDFDKMYHDEQMSEGEIARKLGVTQGAVHYRLIEHNIPRRGHDDSIRLHRKKLNWYGENNPRWTGGRHFNHNGYVMIRDTKHHRSQKRGYVLEHILVWEKHHGEKIPEGFIIHHVNGIPSDNRPENLLAMPNKKHINLIPELEKRIRVLELKIKKQGG